MNNKKPKNRSKDKRIFMDHASTTPVLKEVVSAMNPFFDKYFENPSAIYKEGVFTKNKLEESRGIIGNILNARPDELIFTASGTESNNIALFGVVKDFMSQDKNKTKQPHIITTSIEHPSILNVCEEIKKIGGKVTVIPVDEYGVVSIQKIKESITKNTVLVSVMYANNEIGTIEPIEDIAKTIRKARNNYNHQYPYFHTDASQAGNYLTLNVLKLGVDLLTLDGSKIYGPKGVGLLFVKRGIKLYPIIFGGGQENDIRSGTENIPLIVGFSKALEIANREKEKETKRLTFLRDYFIDKVLKNIKGSSLNGHSILRLPNNVNICIPGLMSEFAVIKLDEKGILCSFSSSCQTLKENNASYVIKNLGKEKCDESSLRFTMGRSTKKNEVDYVINNLMDIILK